MGEKWRPRSGGLAELATRQHGVVSIRQLLGPLGYSKSAVSRAVADGRLHRIHQGVYAVGHTNLSQLGLCLAAVLGAGPNALLSHRSAGWLWGIWRSSPAPYEVTGPVPRRPKPPLIVHRARCLMPEDRALAERVPVTAVPRTLLDLAASVRRDRLDRCIERADELRLFDIRQVDALLRRTVGHGGHGRLRRALALYREPAFTRSRLERRLLDLIRAAGQASPATGFNVAGHELDLYWPRERFAVEIDTFKTHGTRAAFERDRKRDADLRAAGVEVERVTGLRIERESQEVVRHILELLARRRLVASGENV
jgi:very-short-patch-repair endonuclease